MGSFRPAVIDLWATLTIKSQRWTNRGAWKKLLRIWSGLSRMSLHSFLPPTRLELVKRSVKLATRTLRLSTCGSKTFNKSWRMTALSSLLPSPNSRKLFTEVWRALTLNTTFSRASKMTKSSQITFRPLWCSKIDSKRRTLSTKEAKMLKS